MKEIPDCSVNLVLTDPPYKLNKTTGGMTRKGLANRWTGNIKGSDVKASILNEVRFSEWMPEVYRVLKENSHCYIWVNDKNLSDMQREAEAVGFKLHNILVWKKNNATPNRWYMKNCEFILFLRKGASKPINNLGSKQTYEVRNIRGILKHHPTEKPIEVLVGLIENSTNAGEVVMDNFMGSGSTGVACVNTGRRFVGMELDEQFFDVAQRRICEAVAAKRSAEGTR